MRKLAFILGIFATAVCLNASLYAQIPPTNCPTAASIKAGGLVFVERDQAEGAFYVAQIHSYSTPQTWAFVIQVPFNIASNQTQALAKGREFLSFLSANFSTPLYQDGKYYCLYSAKGLLAAAVTPIPLSQIGKSIILK